MLLKTMSNISLQFETVTINLPPWMEVGWVYHHNSTIYPSFEFAEAERRRSQLIPQLCLHMLGVFVGLCLALVHLSVGSIDRSDLVIILAGSAILIASILWGERANKALSEITTPNYDAFVADAREFLLEIHQKLQVDLRTFETDYQDVCVMRSKLGTYLSKACEQIDAKQRSKLVLDAEQERRQVDSLHVSAVKIGSLVKEKLKDYYPVLA
jgi:hypothetical protein